MWKINSKEVLEECVGTFIKNNFSVQKVFYTILQDQYKIDMYIFVPQMAKYFLNKAKGPLNNEEENICNSYQKALQFNKDYSQ